MSEYIPRPIDTSEIELPEELLGLAEQIAENVHDVWALQRKQQGWTYGPERNDARKETPCMVPYGELPEEEKEYDRSTAMSTLRLIRYLGFEIVRKKD